LLSNYRVLDLSDERGHLAGRMLADLGADVIKIEPPGGDGERGREPFPSEQGREKGMSLAWMANNPGKRSLVLDLAPGSQDRAVFAALLATTDVVLDAGPGGKLAGLGFDYPTLCGELPEAHPGLVLALISPFGQAGPYRDFEAHDLVCVAMGGNASVTGDPDRPPLACSLPTAYMHGGAEAVAGILLGLLARPALGAGQVIDVSLQECQLATLISGAGQYPLSPGPRPRTGSRTGATREIWRCRDGWVSYGLRGGPARIPGLVATVKYMAECGMAPDWLQEIDWQAYSPLTLDAEQLGRLEEAFAAFFAERSMRELYDESLRRRILLAPCNDARAILRQPQLRARDFFVPVEYPGLDLVLEQPGFFARTNAGDLGLRGPAPELDAHGAEIRRELRTAPRRAADPEPRAGGRLALETREGCALEGLRVLELGAGAAGPVATGYLAQQGARVIRIESSRRPDFLRLLHVTAENRAEPDILEQAPMFALLNANKESLAVDMKKPAGVALVRRLIEEWADVVAENFAPGVMARWGLDYASLARVRPDLIMVSGCLFGQTGPQRSYPGFGGQGAAIAGFNHMTGWPGCEALGPYGTITDSLSPRFVASAILAALLHLRRTGEGQYVDLSQIETGVYCLAEMIARCSAGDEIMSRRGNRSESAAPHGIYPCRSSEEPSSGSPRENWIALAVYDETQWRALVHCMEDPPWAQQERYATLAARLENADALEERLGAWTRDQDAETLAATLQHAGVEAGAVRDFGGLHADPQLAAREHFVRLEHPVLGPLAYERSGARLSRTPGRLDRPAPRLGEHTRSILSGILGLSAEEIEALAAAEVNL
jgi:crotonobetainyl-CoA:carnitine CoA-transferase CaiB-like acyl-CoA transferase